MKAILQQQQQQQQQWQQQQQQTIPLFCVWFFLLIVWGLRLVFFLWFLFVCLLLPCLLKVTTRAVQYKWV